MVFPSDQLISQAVQALHNAPHLLCVYQTGVTGGLCQWLWNVPGASKTILDFDFLYSRESQDEVLGHTSGSYCSQFHALELAAAAREKATRLAHKRKFFTYPIIGIGITGAVSTDRDRRGDDRVHIAAATKEKMYVFTVMFKKSVYGPMKDTVSEEEFRASYRLEEGKCADLLALNQILQIAGLDQIPLSDLSLLSSYAYLLSSKREGEFVLYDTEVKLPDAYQADPVDKMLCSAGEVVDVQTDDFYLDPHLWIRFPGSFDPLHYGHEEMAQMLERQTGKRVVFEISATHPQKGFIGNEEILRRVSQFRYRWNVLVTRAAGLYVEKAELFPGVPMLIGVDAVINMLNEKYYPDGAKGVRRTLERLSELKTQFYVVSREVDGKFLTRDDLPIPPRFANLFLDVSCRNDVSSTQIRAQQGYGK
ncbi:MAG: Nucleotidyl transferase domain-containing protein [Candidatus Uhrbacteria bacterium GW2011_GWF2_39_13]|uniref:Nucleotidyl transferase domain-containing protein n=1 Tax=Candidatus Uhrbacteria bacterium GW2011_GWF2_39_13 TaxID=1618995 RepID=A0A0G0MPK2_9BACT|nr:MAG: Nucleotidyl transferase domain-containing protein [Candidatus Uhrbacteria bacterium GW2011_GWF2_39_13]HAU66347.1 hypothetical protein [Candidatus Uhrbacteria bacterium]